MAILIFWTLDGVAESPSKHLEESINQSIDAFVELLASAAMSSTEKNLLRHIFSDTYDRKEKLTELTSGKFHLMRFVASFPASIDGGLWIFLDSPQPLPLTDFEMPVIAIFMKDEKIEHWQMVAPGSAGLTRIEYDGTSVVLRSLANWIVRSNRFEYSFNGYSLELVGSKTLALSDKDKPILKPDTKDPGTLIRPLNQLRAYFRRRNKSKVSEQE
ncbi:hypothetical protein [Allorhodopirellula solitaria]|nr:hypothetical protein [Allorhodopirellula solitaria]